MTRTKATENESETMPDDVETLKSELAKLQKEVDELKKREEGWLVWTPDPRFNGQTGSITFTDGMVFIRHDAKYPEGDAEKTVRLLVNDFGYKAEYFTKEQSDELKKKMTQRATERKEVEAKFGTREDMIEKLLVAHRM